MGRRPGTEVNAVVRVDRPQFWTVVDYRTDASSHQYLAVRTDGQGRFPIGPARWLDATEFTDTGRTSRTPGRTYRKIGKHFPEALRLCECVCCPHDSWELDDDA